MVAMSTGPPTQPWPSGNGLPISCWAQLMWSLAMKCTESAGGPLLAG
jgi:hypothetical protein